jgi:hypothetical protein
MEPTEDELTMNYQKAQEIRKKWGFKPCPHPKLEKEDPIAGKWMGDFYCTQCGSLGSSTDFEDLRNAAKKTGE